MKKLLILAALAACSNFPNTSATASYATTYSSAAAGGGTSGTGTRTVSITPAANRLLVVFASVSANTQTTPVMTDNQGGTYTLVGQAYWSASANNMFAFVRNSLASAAATTITLDTNTNTAAELEVVTFAGMTKTGAAAVKQFTSHGNTTKVTVPVLTFSSSVATTDATIVAVASGDTNAAPPSGWTEREDANQSNPVTCLEIATRNSGFSGTTITYGGTQDTSYAEMAIELDGSSSVPPVDAGVDSHAVADAALDAAAPDAAPTDASLVDAGTITFAHGSVSQTYGSGQNPAQVTLDTAASGSTFIVAPGGKTSDINRGPTDNKGNTYTKVGGLDFADWPGYGAYIWSSKNAIGGVGQTWSQYVTRYDEDTTFVIEVPNAGTNPTIISSVMQHDNSGAYEPWLPGEITLTSNSVTTTGPATLIAYWFGSGPTSWGDHIATPNNGFQNLNWWSHDDPNGYVQGYMAYKTVAGAGTYDVTWTYHPVQGAILWLVAVQP